MRLRLTVAYDGTDFHGFAEQVNARTVMGDLRDLALDGEGRIVLPDEFMAAAKLTDQGTFVGAGWKFQIWEPALYAAAKQAKLDRFAKQNGGVA